MMFEDNLKLKAAAKSLDETLRYFQREYNLSDQELALVVAHALGVVVDYYVDCSPQEGQNA